MNKQRSGGKWKVNKLLVLYISIFLVLVSAIIFAINAWNEGYKFDDGGNICVTVNSAGGAQYRVYDTGYSGNSVFVPTKTTAEWDAFVAGKPAGISTGSVPTWYLDVDGDGFYTSTTTSCSSPGAGWRATGSTLGDCDDSVSGYGAGSTRTRYQAASVACGSSCVSEVQTCQSSSTWSGSYTQTNCNVAAGTYYFDGDGDGYGTGAANQCSGASQGGDCRDDTASIYPGSGNTWCTANQANAPKYTNGCTYVRNCYTACDGTGTECATSQVFGSVIDNNNYLCQFSISAPSTVTLPANAEYVIGSFSPYSTTFNGNPVTCQGWDGSSGQICFQCQATGSGGACGGLGTCVSRSWSTQSVISVR